MAELGLGVDNSEQSDCIVRDREDSPPSLAYGALAAAAVVLADGFSPAEAQTALTDVDILNFLLNLEYLQAQYYSFAANGAGIPAADATGTGTAGAASGGRAVSFSDPLTGQYAREMAAATLQHVRYMREQLIIGGGLAVAQPAIDLGTGATGAFSVLMRQAGLIATGASFDPYASDDNFLLGAYFFQDWAVTVYKGISNPLTSKTFLEGLAGIMATKAHHAALVRLTLLQRGVTNPALLNAMQAISDARDAIDGSTDLDQGPVPRGTTSNIAPVDENGLAFGRTPAQALNVVFLQRSAVDRGGFFPAGVNGTVRLSGAN